VVAGLRLEGLTAPAVFDGAIDGVTFLAYVEQVLVPIAQRGDVVVLDNLAVHKQPASVVAAERTVELQSAQPRLACLCTLGQTALAPVLIVPSWTLRALAPWQWTRATCSEWHATPFGHVIDYQLFSSQRTHPARCAGQQ
jgi:hypothetical protein